MKTFLVTYDLVAPGKDYTALIQKLTAMGGRRTQLSAWWVESPLAATELRERLRPHCDVNDRLLVVEVTDWASLNAMAVPKAA